MLDRQLYPSADHAQVSLPSFPKSVWEVSFRRALMALSVNPCPSSITDSQDVSNVLGKNLGTGPEKLIG